MLWNKRSVCSRYTSHICHKRLICALRVFCIHATANINLNCTLFTLSFVSISWKENSLTFSTPEWINNYLKGRNDKPSDTGIHFIFKTRQVNKLNSLVHVVLLQYRGVFTPVKNKKNINFHLFKINDNWYYQGTKEDSLLYKISFIFISIFHLH